MRRSDFLMKLMSVVLCVAIAVYIGVYIYNAVDNPLKTTLAVKYSVSDHGDMEGYIIRTESILTGSGGDVTLMADDGEKVASGQPVAVLYEGESALERASEIRELQLKISQAETSAAAASGQNSTEASDSILALSNAVFHGDLSNLEDLRLSITKTVFTKSADTVSAADLASMKSRLSLLLSQNSDTATYYSPTGGIFSSAVDGYESVGPDILSDLTPSSLAAVFSLPETVSSTSLGKLITGLTWYYAAVVDADDAQKLEGMETASLKFTRAFTARLTMTIESIGPEEDGKCVVVFSSNRGISDMTALRQLTAQIEYSAYTGLLIPKDAVHQPPAHAYRGNQSRTYIYLLTGLQAEKVYVDIISEMGDNYIVKDGIDNKTVLREGSEIIVVARDLYDGKVVA